MREIKKRNKTNEGRKKQKEQESEWKNRKSRKMYLVGVDLQSSVSEQCFVAALATAALNAACRGWFH